MTVNWKLLTSVWHVHSKSLSAPTHMKLWLYGTVRLKSFGTTPICMPCGYLEHWCHLRWNGQPKTFVARWLWNRWTCQNIPQPRHTDRTKLARCYTSPRLQQTFPKWPARPLSQRVPSLDPAGVDLLRKTLIYEPSARITAKTSMDHEYFNGLDKNAVNRW